MERGRKKGRKRGREYRVREDRRHRGGGKEVSEGKGEENEEPLSLFFISKVFFFYIH